jgi:hypothetical protein
MSNTTFVDQSTVVEASWLNDVNDTVYSVLGNGTSVPADALEARINLSAAASGANYDITSLDDPTIMADQVQTASGSKIATNYWVDRRLWGTTRQSVSYCHNLNDTTGAPDWGGSTGGTSLTATHNGLIFSCASATLDINGLRAISSTWTGLSAVSTTYYLYFDHDPSTGATTMGSTTLVPVYTQGDVYSTTNGQHIFSIPDMQMRVGDGTTSTGVYRVFVGEATTDGAGLVSSFIWYNIRGQYFSGSSPINAGTKYTFDHNLGIGGFFLDIRAYIVPHSTTQNGYAPLTSATPQWVDLSTCEGVTVSAKGRNQVVVSTGSNINLVPEAGGAPVAITGSNWYLYVTVKRKW